MLLKIVILSCRKKALMIYSDRSPVSLTSDSDVIPLLLWFTGDPRAHLLVSGETVHGIEVRKFDDEVTVWTDAA